MTQKISKVIICTIAIMCMLCSSLTAFAETGDVDFDFNIQPIEPTTQEETVPAETTEKNTEKETENQTTEKATQKPTKPKTTKPQTTKAEDEPQYNNNSNDDVNVNVQPNNEVTKEETTETTTDETLPDGAFYVYLERNNGQRRLKTVMEKEGFVLAPEDPTREGYVFVGWYRDASFKKPWNFYTDKATKEMTIYAKWAAGADTVVYDIIIESVEGGRLEVNPQKASLGEPVVITVVPDEGKRFVQGSLLINGKPTDFLSFIMPDDNVTISASFEDIPEREDVGTQKSKLPLLIGVGVVVLVILVIAIIIAKKRSTFDADFDPEEDMPVVEEDYDDWIDETIIVEDGFKEGKKVVESIEPDYGAPDSDEE